MLKTKLRESSEIAFSMKWELLYEIPKIDIIQTTTIPIFIYDVEVVHDRDLLIFGTNTWLNIFNLTTRTQKRMTQLLHDIHDIVVDGEYLFLTTGTRLMKYNLTRLLEGTEVEKALIWESSPNLSNCWGLALYQMNSKKYAFVMDCSYGIIVFDTETGQQVEINVPKIKLGYGITFTDENEMIISTSDKSAGPVQILTFDIESQSWKKSREAVRNETFNTAYGIYYERKTKLIYLADAFGNQITVLNKKTMQVVQEWNTNEKRVFGITYDPKKGYLYLPCVFESIIIVK